MQWCRTSNNSLSFVRSALAFSSKFQLYQNTKFMNYYASNQAAQERMFKQDEKLIRDLALKVRIFSGAAQNVIINALSHAQREFPKYFRQDTKQQLKRVRRALVDLSTDEHTITQDFAVDEYFDDRADDLHRITKDGVERIYNVFYSLFDKNGYNDAQLYASLCTAYTTLNVSVHVMELTTDEQPIAEFVKPRYKKAFIEPYRGLYKMLGTLMHKVFAQARTERLLTIDDDRNLQLPDEYATAIEKAATDYGIALVSRETWHELAQREHEQLGDKAMLNLNPKSFEEITK